MATLALTLYTGWMGWILWTHAQESKRARRWMQLYRLLLRAGMDHVTACEATARRIP